MEEEVDLREYVDVIVRRWKWIAGITLVAVVTAAIVSFLVITPVYEATAIILVPPEESGSPPYSLQIANASVEAQVVEHLGSSLPTKSEFQVGCCAPSRCPTTPNRTLCGSQ